MATLLRASMLLRIGHGERQLVERELRSDHRVMQRVNLGEPIKEDDWTEVGRFESVSAERARLEREGWAIEDV
jgi:hypothetical protein